MNRAYLSSFGPVCSGDQRVGNSLTNLWNEREARRNEWENSLLVDVETQFVPWLLVVTRSHKLDRFLDPEPCSGERSDSVPVEDAVRALQQQVNALMSQNAALEAQLISQQNIAQGLTELPGAITTVLSRSQAPTKRMLVDPKGLGKPPMFSGREEDFYVWTKKIENCVSGVFPNVRGALAFAAESQDVVTAATIAIGVPELEVETSAEIDVQLFVVFSALTEGEGFDIVMSVGGDHGFESWRKLHGRWNPYTAGRARSLLREILSPSRVKLLELMGAVDKMLKEMHTLLRKTFA